MAGIMGGDESAVADSTSDILFESAWFNPLAIAGKARNYGKHTDSSHRFERGVDSRSAGCRHRARHGPNAGNLWRQCWPCIS